MVLHPVLSRTAKSRKAKISSGVSIVCTHRGIEEHSVGLPAYVTASQAYTIAIEPRAVSLVTLRTDPELEVGLFDSS